MKKEVTRNHKEEMESQKLYFTDYNLFIVKDLWQGRYQFLLIIMLKELMISNDNKCETCGIKCNHCECFLDYTSVKDCLIT